jgi:hypothetical protein
LSAEKHDADKARYDRIPPHALDAVAQVLRFGADKYGDDDGWRHVPNLRVRYFAATMRHAWAWMRGEALDPESGLPHLAHAVCSLMFILDVEQCETVSGYAHDGVRQTALVRGDS